MFPQMNIVNEIFISSQKNEKKKWKMKNEKMWKKIRNFFEKKIEKKSKKNRKKIEKKSPRNCELVLLQREKNESKTILALGSWHDLLCSFEMSVRPFVRSFVRP